MMADADRISYCGFNAADITTEFADGDEIEEERQTVKKLSDAFDSCAKGEGSMKVYLRIRPMPSKCTSESTIIVESDQTIVTNAPESSKRAQYTKLEERKYAFSRVFSPSSLQSDVYEHTMSPLLDRFVKGDNCVFFAYGMTNSGKTHTIQGCNADQGLLPRLVADILRSIADSPVDEWRLSVSVLEIYQEKIFDLLCKKSEKSDKPEKLTIRDGNGKIEVCKLSEHSVTSLMDATKIMDLAATNRSKSTTLLNSGSSRSHAVYTLKLKSDNLGKDVVFHVVDLAGAERSNRTKANVQQQKEANNINTSLMQLWRCLQSMQRKSSDCPSERNIDIIPFRDSKLTHLLMPQLCRAGLSGVAMIACVNPQIDDYDETLSILGNASLASKIREITEIRRPAPTSSHLQQSTSEELLLSKVGIVAANAISAATALGKRRRAESNNLTQADPTALEKRISKRCSAIAQKASAPGPVEEKVRPVSKRVGAVKSIADTVVEKADAEDEKAISGVKRLRDEISRLTVENNLLLSEQFTRETDIRIEVSIEMAKRSAHLLDQIQDLQSQLDGKDSSAEDLSKSCKKMRRIQLDKANDDMARDLEEAEEELERVKVDYEEQLLQLRVEKANLAAELHEWKSKIVFQQTTLIKSMSPPRASAAQGNTRSSSATLCDETLPATSLIEVKVNVGTEQPKRMSRDTKCKKAEKESECASKLHAIRSPLGPVKLDPNSEKSPRDFSVSWESPEGDGISPLRFDSSPKEMFRHKENVNAQLQQSFSASKGFRNSCNKSVASNEKPGAHSHGDAKQVPKARANVVSARRVVSTRLTHQAPEDLTAHEDANCGANPNAGNYISRLRTRTVR